MMYLFKNCTFCFLHHKHFLIGSQTEVISHERDGCHTNNSYYKETKNGIVHHIVDDGWHDGGEGHHDEYLRIDVGEIISDAQAYQWAQHRHACQLAHALHHEMHDEDAIGRQA